ncbi:hypothetical protein MESS2_1680028 [Mesorhizobium metallidurans STM 2683]|uniref:Uncharacterized protein n=2 Tax=Mesorhizobium TaxID=68287 RepID=M5EM97_9HYPH|nr:hypothetical protein MESS2_1680028 [Mesorhizobium metallidurans STM 2683]
MLSGEDGFGRADTSPVLNAKRRCPVPNTIRSPAAAAMRIHAAVHPPGELAGLLQLPWRGGRVLEPGIRTGGFFTATNRTDRRQSARVLGFNILRDRARGDGCKARGAG